MFFEQIMIFRSNKHFLVHFGGVRVAGGEKIAADVSDTEATNRLVHHHDQPVQPVQKLHQPVRWPLNRFIMHRKGATVPGDFQPVHQLHQPVQCFTNRLETSSIGSLEGAHTLHQSGDQPIGW